jgi:hypothetical protein
MRIALRWAYRSASLLTRKRYRSTTVLPVAVRQRPVMALPGISRGHGLTSAVRFGKRTSEDLGDDCYGLARRDLAEFRAGLEPAEEQTWHGPD